MTINITRKGIKRKISLFLSFIKETRKIAYIIQLNDTLLATEFNHAHTYLDCFFYLWRVLILNKHFYLR